MSEAPPPPPAPAPAPAPGSVAEKVTTILEQWFTDNFHGQPWDTPTFNRFYEAKETLKARLLAVVQ